MEQACSDPVREPGISQKTVINLINQEVAQQLLQICLDLNGLATSEGRSNCELRGAGEETSAMSNN